MAWSHSNAVRFSGYVVVALSQLVALRRERRRVGDEGWPAFWIATALCLLAMASAEALGVGNLVSSVGRRVADVGGWYGDRRPLQTAAIGTVGVVWIVAVTVAWRRTSERRRRYLTVGVLVVSLAAFAAVRVVSLHQVDGLLYRAEVGGVPIARLVEGALLVSTAVATLWCSSDRSVGVRGREPGRASTPSHGASFRLRSPTIGHGRRGPTESPDPGGRV